MRTAAGGLFFLALVAAPASAEVVAAIASEQLHGQAYVFRLPSGCFAATPEHVVKAADGALLAPILRARDGREGQGQTPVRPEADLDLVFVRVAGALTSPCGSAENLGYDSLDHRLPALKDLTLRVARTGTSVQQVPMRLSKFNKNYVFASPVSGQEVDTVMQSMSGGLLVDDQGVPIGMLLSVNNEDGLAQALRFDRIKRLAMDKLSASAPAVSGESARANVRLAQWTGETLDPNHPPGAVLQGGVWRAKPVARRAELVLAVEGGKKISRIVVARPATPAEEPDVLTVWTAQRSGQEWVLVRTCSKAAGTGGSLFDCAIAPTDAGAIRLEFGQRAGAVLSVGAVQLQ